MKLLGKKEIESLDALLNAFGGPEEIERKICKSSAYEFRKEQLKQTEWYEFLQKTEELKLRLPVHENIHTNTEKGIATVQVSGFQGVVATYICLQDMTNSKEKCYLPAEMISVVPLTKEYVKSGELTAVLACTENILGVDRFCVSHFIGVPRSEKSFLELERITGEKFNRERISEEESQLILINQGTFFGNFCGIECANNNHLVYLDGITQVAIETGASFFLNPSWSTIVSTCYYARQIPSLRFKVSMLLSAQNTIQFKLLLNIISEYLRDDKTSPIVEINIGNGISPEQFINCSKILKNSGIKGINLAAHICINTDLGREDFNWFENAGKVLDSGEDITIKYESSSKNGEFDTMSIYFLNDEERLRNSKEIGEALYQKCQKASNDALKLAKDGCEIKFTNPSHKE